MQPHKALSLPNFQPKRNCIRAISMKISWQRCFGVIYSLFLLAILCMWSWTWSLNDSELLHPSKRSSFLLDKIDLDCAKLGEGQAQSVEYYKKWKFDYRELEREINNFSNTCHIFHSYFEFRSKPLSKEEFDYPLAYGVLVHDRIVQFLFMISSFYHPQNVYCIAVDQGAKQEFKNVVNNLQRCLPNVHVLNAGRTSWGSYEILDAMYKCVNYTAHLDHPWKYYQYLSGVDTPLKTNLEMVRIFKALNETINIEMTETSLYNRFRKKKSFNRSLPFHKASMSALLPRSAISYITKSEKVTELLNILRNTAIPDESFWGTVSGNREVFDPPGAISHKEYFEFKRRLKKQSIQPRYHSPSLDTPSRYYISRFQVWSGGICKGKYTSASCVYGAGDVHALFNRPELVAHKFYLDYQPAAFLCVLKEISNRSLTPRPYSARLYSELPQVELKMGKKYEELTHPEWI